MGAILPLAIGACQEYAGECRMAIEMSTLNAVEMSGFLVGIKRSFLPWARRSHVCHHRGKRPDRDESNGTGSVEGVVWGDPGRTLAKGGSQVVTPHGASSSPSAAAN